MNCNVYFFIGTQKGYSQYPDNYSEGIISNILANTDRKKNLSQFAISMNGKLAYMTYQYRCSDSKYFGICCEYNNVVPTNFEYLFEFFDNIVQDILTKGEILHYDSTGIICPSIDYISDKIELVNYYSSYISNNLNDRLAKYVNLPSQNYTSEKNKLVVLAYDDNHTQLIDLLNTYDNVVISRDNPYVLGYANTLKKSSEKISQLETELDKINRQKKQYKFVVTLFVIVILCCVGLFLFYKEITSKTEHIQKLEKEINIKIDSLALQTNKISSLKQELNNVTGFTSSTGASMRNNDRSDSNWIMWVKANTRVKITSFYVKGGNSSNGEVVLAIYDSNDNLIATKTTNISSSEFKKVTLGDSWQLKKGAYYIRIKESNGRSLQYHSSNDKEYAQFTGGALEVTGCSSYSDRNNDGSRNKHGYYQYFYNIQYEIIPEISELNDPNNLIIIQ